MTSLIAPAYLRPFYFALGQQAPLALFSLLLLDGGQFARVVGIALAGFWTAVVCIVVRRPVHPTPGDLTFIRVGVWPVLFMVVVASLVFRA